MEAPHSCDDGLGVIGNVSSSSPSSPLPPSSSPAALPFSSTAPLSSSLPVSAASTSIASLSKFLPRPPSSSSSRKEALHDDQIDQCDRGHSVNYFQFRYHQSYQRKNLNPAFKPKYQSGFSKSKELMMKTFENATSTFVSLITKCLGMTCSQRRRVDDACDEDDDEEENEKLVLDLDLRHPYQLLQRQNHENQACNIFFGSGHDLHQDDDAPFDIADQNLGDVMIERSFCDKGDRYQGLCIFSDDDNEVDCPKRLSDEASEVSSYRDNDAHGVHRGESNEAYDDGGGSVGKTKEESSLKRRWRNKSRVMGDEVGGEEDDNDDDDDDDDGYDYCHVSDDNAGTSVLDGEDSHRILDRYNNYFPIQLSGKKRKPTHVAQVNGTEKVLDDRFGRQGNFQRDGDAAAITATEAAAGSIIERGNSHDIEERIESGGRRVDETPEVIRNSELLASDTQHSETTLMASTPLPPATLPFPTDFSHGFEDIRDQDNLDVDYHDYFGDSRVVYSMNMHTEMNNGEGMKGNGGGLSPSSMASTASTPPSASTPIPSSPTSSSSPSPSPANSTPPSPTSSSSSSACLALALSESPPSSVLPLISSAQPPNSLSSPRTCVTLPSSCPFPFELSVHGDFGSECVEAEFCNGAIRPVDLSIDNFRSVTPLT